MARWGASRRSSSCSSSQDEQVVVLHACRVQPLHPVAQRLAIEQQHLLVCRGARVYGQQLTQLPDCRSCLDSDGVHVVRVCRHRQLDLARHGKRLRTRAPGSSALCRSPPAWRLPAALNPPPEPMASRLLARCICGPLRRSGALRRAAGSGGAPPGRRIVVATPPATPLLARARAVGTAAAAAPPSTVSTGAASRGTGSGGAPAQGPTFQQAIQRLTDYWASVGCAVYLPHNTEVRPRPACTVNYVTAVWAAWRGCVHGGPLRVECVIFAFAATHLSSSLLPPCANRWAQAP